MRIGIDCRTILNPKLGERGGIGYYTLYLVRHILEQDKTNEYHLYVDHRMPNVAEFEQSNVRIRRLPFSQYHRFLPFAYSHMLLSAYLMKERLDLFHSPTATLPLTYPGKTAVTVHDLAIYINPAWFPSQIMDTRLLIPRTLRSADAIISVSNSTKKDLREMFNVPETKITVIHQGGAMKKIPVQNKKIDSLAKYKLPKEFFLYVGSINRRKNLVTLLRAYRQLITGDPSLKRVMLVLAGHKEYQHEEVFGAIKELKLARQVKYIGYVTHNQKIELIKKAAAFVYPSHYEGFGLPILEAMGLGVPVICSKASSLPEISGSSALLFDPTDEAELTAALKEVATNETLRKKLGEQGKAQAAKFTWIKCAAETIKFYQRVTAEPVTP